MRQGPANELLQRCSAHPGSAEDVACLTWIEGFVDGIALGQSGKNWCFPEGGSVGQARLIIENVLREHPEMLHRDAAMVAGAALMSAFPCKGSD
jgi:Rap1a immunity proteins